LDETNPVKYLNTGETATFKKSRVLYGISQALNFHFLYKTGPIKRTDPPAFPLATLFFRKKAA